MPDGSPGDRRDDAGDGHEEPTDRPHPTLVLRRYFLFSVRFTFGTLGHRGRLDGLHGKKLDIVQVR